MTRVLVGVLCLLLVLAGSAQAQTFMRNDNAAQIQGNGDQKPSAAAVDPYGRIFSMSSDAATGLLQSIINLNHQSSLNGPPVGMVAFRNLIANAGAATATGGTTTTITGSGFSATWAGKYVQMRAGTTANIGAWSRIAAATTTLLTLQQPLPQAPANSDSFWVLQPEPVALAENVNTGHQPVLAVTLDARYQGSATNGIVKLEDAVAGSGDAGIPSWSVRNANTTALAAEGDYQPFGTGTFGNLLGTLVFDSNVSTSVQPVRPEDSAFTDTQAVMMSGGVNNRGLTLFNSTQGDATPLATDDAGANLSTLVAPNGMSAVLSAVIREDVATADQQTVVMAGAVNNGSLITTFNTVAGDATPIGVGNNGQVLTQHVGAAQGGGTLFNLISAATTNQTAVKTSAGTLYSFSACNVNAAVRWVKLYDSTGPTCGTSTPNMRFAIPPNNCISAEFPIGAAFSSGIGLCTVTGAANSDATAVAANEVTVQMTYR